MAPADLFVPQGTRVLVDIIFQVISIMLKQTNATKVSTGTLKYRGMNLFKNNAGSFNDQYCASI